MIVPPGKIELLFSLDLETPNKQSMSYQSFSCGTPWTGALSCPPDNHTKDMKWGRAALPADDSDYSPPLAPIHPGEINKHFAHSGEFGGDGDSGWRTLHIGGRVLDRGGIQAPPLMRTRGPGSLPKFDPDAPLRDRTPSPPSPMELQRTAQASTTAQAWWSDDCYNTGAGVVMEYDQVIGSVPGPESDAALICAGEKLRAFGVITGTDLKANGIMWRDARIIGTVLTGSGRRAADTRLSNPTRKHRACWGSVSKEPGLPLTGIDGNDDIIREDGAAILIPTSPRQNMPWDYPQNVSSENWIRKLKEQTRRETENAIVSAARAEDEKRWHAKHEKELRFHTLRLALNEWRTQHICNTCPAPLHDEATAFCEAFQGALW